MINYILESTICLVLLLLCYLTLFKNDKLLVYKRFFLLASLLFSLLLPLFELNIVLNNNDTGDSFSIVYASRVLDFINHPTGQADIINSPVDADTNNGDSQLLQFFVLIYFLGFGLFLTRFVTNLYRLISKAGKLPQVLYRGVPVVLVKDKTSPHSFFNYIFISDSDYENMSISNDMLQHELAHVRQNHSIDIIFIECLQVLLWFNPVLIFYKKLIKANHEYLADEYALLRSEGSRLNYMEKLVSSSYLDTEISLSSGFSNTLIKRRLIMMNKHKKPGYSLFKTFILLPVTVLLVISLTSGKHILQTGIASSEEIMSGHNGQKSLVLTDGYLKATGFEEKNGNPYFVNVSDDYKYVFEIKDGHVNTSIYDKAGELATGRDYYPVLISNPQGDFKYSSFNEEGLYSPLIALNIQQFTFYFTFTEQLEEKLSSIENLDEYVIRDVQYLEMILSELTSKSSEKKRI